MPARDTSAPDASALDSAANVYGALRAAFPAADRPFLRPAGRPDITYGDMEQHTARLAAALADAGVGAGDIVAMLIDKSPEGILLYLAICRIGAVFLPVHTGLSDREIGHILADADPRLVICDPRYTPLVDGRAYRTLDRNGTGSLTECAGRLQPLVQLAPRAADDPNALVYTSGTTGRPKGAWITCGQVNWNVAAIRDMWQVGPDDVLLHVNLMAFGIFATTLPLLAGGASMVVVPDASVDTIFSRLPEVTMLATVPTVYQRMLADPRLTREACAGMRLFITGSAPMRADLFEAFHERTGHRLLDRYGMTELLLIASNRADDMREAGNSGYALPGSRIRIVGEDGKELAPGEIGAIEVLQPERFIGYLNADDKTAASFTADGWFRTGDFGRLDQAGRVSVFGRGVDLIITGGLNVYPIEVEQAINAVEGVAESAVIGIPHPEYGEAVVAVVELDHNAQGRLEIGELLRLLRGSIARYKVPKHVEIVSSLPRNALGKIKKQELRDRLLSHFLSQAEAGE